MMKLILSTLLFALSACSGPASSTSFAPAAAPNGPGIYYWKTTWELDAPAKENLVTYGTKQLFLRLFDVDYDFNSHEARPKGLLELPDNLGLKDDLALVPVVFIVERVFRQDVKAEDLAERISRTIIGMSGEHPELATATRWQIDCDWTPTSRDRYFAFLNALQKQNPKLTLSVTVRLHQYRERVKNGIPPVPQGLLMCYNMEPVSDANSPNAIYQEDLLRGYLKAPPYPLLLDAALPVFSWGAAFRDDRLLGIVPPPEEKPGALQKVTPSRFLVLRDTTIGTIFLRAGDNIRHDGPGSTAYLMVAAELLKQKPEVRDLLFFDWQEGVLEEYKIGEIWGNFYR
jgi:hypothetical protein